MLESKHCIFGYNQMSMNVIIVSLAISLRKSTYLNWLLSVCVCIQVVMMTERLVLPDMFNVWSIYFNEAKFSLWNWKQAHLKCLKIKTSFFSLNRIKLYRNLAWFTIQLVCMCIWIFGNSVKWLCFDVWISVSHFVCWAYV